MFCKAKTTMRGLVLPCTQTNTNGQGLCYYHAKMANKDLAMDPHRDTSKVEASGRQLYPR